MLGWAAAATPRVASLYTLVILASCVLRCGKAGKGVLLPQSLVRNGSTSLVFCRDEDRAVSSPLPSPSTTGVFGPFPPMAGSP